MQYTFLNIYLTIRFVCVDIDAASVVAASPSTPCGTSRHAYNVMLAFVTCVWQWLRGSAWYGWKEQIKGYRMVLESLILVGYWRRCRCLKIRVFRTKM
jgi:hypothetical protein